MPAATRVADIHTVALNATGSSDTLINGRGAHRIGDVHIPPCIEGSGSGLVIINGRGASRVGDIHIPPIVESSGSPDTYFG